MSKGLKRICMNCSARFYDMDQRPIICPVCGTEFNADAKIKPKRGRPAAEDTKPAKEAEEAKAEDQDDEIDEIDADDDFVSLDDVDEGDDLDDEDEDRQLTIDDDPDDLDDIWTTMIMTSTMRMMRKKTRKSN